MQDINAVSSVYVCISMCVCECVYLWDTFAIIVTWASSSCWVRDQGQLATCRWQFIKSITFGFDILNKHIFTSQSAGPQLSTMDHPPFDAHFCCTATTIVVVVAVALWWAVVGQIVSAAEVEICSWKMYKLVTATNARTCYPARSFTSSAPPSIAVVAIVRSQTCDVDMASTQYFERLVYC